MSFKSNILSDAEIQARIEALELELEFYRGLLRLNELGRAEAMLEIFKMSMQSKYTRRGVANDKGRTETATAKLSKSEGGV